MKADIEHQAHLGEGKRAEPFASAPNAGVNEAVGVMVGVGVEVGVAVDLAVGDHSAVLEGVGKGACVVVAVSVRVGGLPELQAVINRLSGIKTINNINPERILELLHNIEIIGAGRISVNPKKPDGQKI